MSFLNYQLIGLAIITFILELARAFTFAFSSIFTGFGCFGGLTIDIVVPIIVLNPNPKIANLIR